MEPYPVGEDGVVRPLELLRKAKPTHVVSAAADIDASPSSRPYVKAKVTASIRTPAYAHPHRPWMITPSSEKTPPDRFNFRPKAY